MKDQTILQLIDRLPTNAYIRKKDLKGEKFSIFIPKDMSWVSYDGNSLPKLLADVLTEIGR